ncbi:MAG: hypothetical protein QM657_14895 [Lacrimispora sp.]|uniref:hypothetical protein n=1 Tax=Lacrimispora sp. TaxID=2719234 RepID=UPI0039E69E3D
MNKIMRTQKKIEKAVVGGYKAIENSVVSGYQKIEDTVVTKYKKIENEFVDAFLTPDESGPETGTQSSDDDEQE